MGSAIGDTDYERQGARIVPRVEDVWDGSEMVEEHLPEADLVIGTVLVHGARAPHVITRAQLGLMKPQAVLVDVSIDQGGCFETSRPTTHFDPTFDVGDDAPTLRAGAASGVPRPGVPGRLHGPARPSPGSQAAQRRMGGRLPPGHIDRPLGAGRVRKPGAGRPAAEDSDPSCSMCCVA